MSEKYIDEAEVVDVEIGPVEAGDETPSKQASSSRLPLILAMVSLVVLVAGLVAGYLSWRDMRDSLFQVDTALVKAKQEQQALLANIETTQHVLSEQQKRLQDQEQAFENAKRSFADQANSLEAERRKLEQRETELEDALRAVHRRIGTGTGQWMVAEAEYLMRVANHRLQLEGDIKTALAALRAADQRLRDTGDPGWNSTREVLGEEISSLGSIEELDLAGMAATLTALANRLHELKPVGAGEQSRAAPGRDPAKSGEDEKSFQTLLRDGWEGFKSVMVIRRHDKPVVAMIPPNQLYFVIQNLRLQLESARFAALRGDTSLFHSSLNTADNWLREFFDKEDAVTRSYLQQLETLRKVDIHPVLPDISRSLRRLRERDRELAQEQGA